MKAPNTVRIISAVLFGLVILSISIKLIPISKNLDNFHAEKMYRVTYRYFLKTASESTLIKTYLPKNNDRQRVGGQRSSAAPYWNFTQKASNNNMKGIWKTSKANSFDDISYSFVFEGKAKSYAVPVNFTSETSQHQYYLKSSQYIQSNHKEIDSLAKKLTQRSTNDREVIQNLFQFVQAIPAAPIITLTDAVTVIAQNRASCNGKSRLLAALARNLGYPARLKGGIILEETNKRTSHAWVEIYINGQWIPFDTLNDHFAYLPSNYMELYEGDVFLITHTSGVDFDYTYEIQEQTKVPFLRMNAHDFGKISPISLWSLIENKVLSMEALLLLLMLPLGGLLVAFLRNVVGLKTFGVFLPVLIAFSLLETGFTTGILLFLFLILFVGLVSRPFNAMGLLHTPKLVVSLTLMVLIMIIGACIGVHTKIPWLSALTFFPTIILTVSAEKFSTLIIEDGFPKATSTLFQTLIAVCFCYFMLSSPLLSSILILLPEILLLIIVLAMSLGKYIGLRWTELIRFKPLLNFKTI